jgi:hypothetical protein
MIKTILQENKELIKLVSQLNELIDIQKAELTELRYYRILQKNKHNDIVILEVIEEDIIQEVIVEEDIEEDIEEEVIEEDIIQEDIIQEDIVEDIIQEVIEETGASQHPEEDIIQEDIVEDIIQEVIEEVIEEDIVENVKPTCRHKCVICSYKNNCLKCKHL